MIHEDYLVLRARKSASCLVCGGHKPAGHFICNDCYRVKTGSEIFEAIEAAVTHATGGKEKDG
jgi:hypothetical protein